MDMIFRRFDLQLRNTWTIASKLGPGGGGGMDDFPVVLVELRDKDGVLGVGEAAPSTRYNENPDSVLAFLEDVDAAELSFGDVAGSMAYLDSLAEGQFAPKCALNLALLDGAGHGAGKPVHALLGLDFKDDIHLTSFSIGIDTPEKIRAKVLDAAPFPILKLKVGGATDKDNLAALRDAAPKRTLRVDANEAWKTKEEALRQIEWLAQDSHVEFIEQPMPASSAPADLAWLKARSPLPVFADESYRSAGDAALCADCFHGVNVKLVKTGGISAAHEALVAARRAGLQTMIGCMIETSVLISAGAHLAACADHLDLDGNLLCSNDPYQGVTAVGGMMSFEHAPVPTGLRVRRHQ